MSDDAYLLATYSVAVPADPEKAAEVLAGEQSAGTFTAVAGDTPELQRQFGARVVSVEPTGSTRAPARSYDRAPGGPPLPEYLIRIAFPAANVSASASHLMTVAAGNLFELKWLGGVRLEGLEIPDRLAAAIALPTDGGLARTRGSVGRSHGPMLGTIIKPSIGLPNSEAARLAWELIGAGLDVIKDDELNADLDAAPLLDRIDRVQAAVGGLADSGGQYAYNITGTLDHMKRAADHIERRGGTTAMVVVPWVGLEAFAELRRHTPLVLQAHRAGWGALDRSADIGISFAVYAQVLRLLGADQIHVGGLRSKFWEHSESIEASVASVSRTPWHVPPAVPVLSSAQTVLTAADSHRTFGTDDLLVMAGGGIHAHPNGAVAGVRSLRAAWEAAGAGVELSEAAATHPDLAAAVDHFGALD